MSKTSRSIFDALRLMLRAQPRSRNFNSGYTNLTRTVSNQWDENNANIETRNFRHSAEARRSFCQH